MKWRCRARLLQDGSAILHTPPPTTPLHHWSCVLCNQLACSTVLLQLITWTVNSGQLCLKKNTAPPKTHDAENLSAAPLRQATSQELNFKNKTEIQNLSSYSSERTCFGVNLVILPSGMPTWQQCPFHSFPFLLHQAASSLRQGPAIRNNRQ